MTELKQGGPLRAITTLRPVSLNSISSIERFYREVDAAVLACRPLEPLVLDLSWVGFLPPEGIIALVTAARLWHGATGAPVRLSNLRSDVHRYCDRMDVFRQCGTWIEEERPLAEEERFDRAPASSNLLEVHPIASDEDRNSQDVAVALARAARIVDAWFDADAAAVGRLLTMLSEIASNVVHSRDQGFAAMQRYRDDTRQFGSRVTMAVGDSGIGIEASLRAKARTGSRPTRLTSGSDYILHALELGVTSRDSTGGVGLYRVKGLVEEWRGSLIIRSGRSMARVSAEGIETWDDLANIPGTQVTITVQGSLVGMG